MNSYNHLKAIRRSRGEPVFLISDHAAAVREIVQHRFELSAEYAESSAALDWAPIAFDRVLLGLRGHVEFTKLDDMTEALAAVLSAHQDGRHQDRDRASERWLEQHFEHWAKALWWLVDANDYKAAQSEAEMRRAQGKNPQFNLFAALTRLELLTIAEANKDVNEIGSIEDPVRRALAHSRMARNQAHTPGASGIPHATELCFLSILAPIVKHAAKLRQALMGVLVRPLDLTTERLQLVRSVSEARRNHLRRFGGRQRWLEVIRRKLVEMSTEGGYLVLTGPEGQGKSALCAKLSEELCSECRPIGPAAARVPRDAPWLPGIIMHMGKQSRNPRDVVQVIVSQASSLLLRRVALPGESALSIYSPTSAANIDPDYSEVRTRPMPREERFGGGGRAASRRETLDDDRSVLFDACHRLVEERGSAFVVIDAIDEITRDGEGLRFLPDPVPRGAIFLLTVRSNLGLEAWLQTNRTNVEIVRLENLERSEVPLLTKVADEGEGIPFNDGAFDHSSGWAYMLASIGVQVEKHEGNFKRVEFAGVAQAMLERQAEEWRSSEDPSRDPLALLLPALSLLEPCAPISVDGLQSYLMHQGIGLRRSELATLLRSVGHQLEGLSANRVKLAQSVFAEYVRETYLSALDHRFVVGQIGSWLAVDDVVEPELVVRFLGYRPAPGDRSIASNVAGDLVSAMHAGARPDALFRIGAALVREERSEEALQFFEAAVDLGHVGACAGLGSELYFRESPKPDESRAEELFRRAINGGHRHAMVLLSMLLADKPSLEAQEEATRLLRRASDDQPLAMWILADRLFAGLGTEKDEQEAETCLRRAAASGLSSAARALGGRLIDGKGVAKNRAEALEIWRRLASDGDESAMYLLGLHLGKEDVPGDKEEMRKWLQRAADKDHPGACTILGHRMLYGIDYPQSVTQGELWLRRAVVHGSSRAKAFLGDAILDGEAETQSMEEGRQLLEAAAAQHDVVGVTELGFRLSRGKGFELDLPRGLSLLREAATADHPRAMLELGCLLLDEGEGEEGEKWLRASQGLGSQAAVLELAERLSLGKGLEKDEGAAREVLAEGANAGSIVAMRKLAGMAETLEEAISWLKRVAAVEHAAYAEIGLKYHEAGRMEDAAAAFFAGHLDQERDCSNNLAYILRRGEVPDPSGFPTVGQLLEDWIDSKDAFVLINLALFEVQQAAGPGAWKKADALIAQIEHQAEDAAEWWQELAVKGEAEGHLVIWWLACHRKVADPHGLSLDERLLLVGPDLRPPESLRPSASEGHDSRA